MITGTVNRVEPRAIILDVGKGVEAILATTEQSPVEHYRIGQNVKAYVLEVRRTSRGPQIFVSRTHKGFLKRLFELEVPEIHNGTVEIKAIAREAGSRSKVAVSSRQEGLDPVGATVGQRGARVQSVVAELGGEKIDVIPWNDDAGVFVANALSPAQVLGVEIDEEHRIANVTVPERMLSLAIGREGQNARLAARLTGWRIDIRSDVSVAEAKAAAEERRRAGGHGPRRAPPRSRSRPRRRRRPPRSPATAGEASTRCRREAAPARSRDAKSGGRAADTERQRPSRAPSRGRRRAEEPRRPKPRAKARPRPPRRTGRKPPRLMPPNGTAPKTSGASPARGAGTTTTAPARPPPRRWRRSREAPSGDAPAPASRPARASPAARRGRKRDLVRDRPDARRARSSIDATGRARRPRRLPLPDAALLALAARARRPRAGPRGSPSPRRSRSDAGGRDPTTLRSQEESSGQE